MDPRQPFALNPHAASYIPISKREGYTGDDETLNPQCPTQQHDASLNYGAQGMKNYQGSEVSVPKTPSGMADKQISDEDLDMDMDVEFLLMTFPGLSYDSIASVYLANDRDVEATADMLTQLESYSSESGNLPDTLDIGDVAESGPSTSTASKPKNAATEATASSSGTPDVPASSS